MHINPPSRAALCATLLAVVIAMAWTSVVHAQKQLVTVVRNGTPAPGLPVLRVDGVIFVATSDLAAVVGARESHAADEASVYIDAAHVTFRSGSPFVWLVRGEQRRLLQIPLEPFLSKGTLYVPLGGAVRVLQRTGGIVLSYDATRERLTIGAAVSRPDTARRVATTPRKDTTRPAITPPVRTPEKAAVKPLRRDTITFIDAEAKANGVLIRLTYAHAAPKGALPTLADSTTVDIALGSAVIDTESVRLEADGLIIEHAFIHDTSGTVLRVRTADPVQGATRQADRARASVILRTSRVTKVTKEQRAGQERWKMDIVVLDAGHGGKDPGAQGLGGTNEKDVTLGVVLKLGRLLEKAGFTVVYTRTTDVFVELYRRAQIANEAKGKLFVSVHCNSMPSKPNPANGFESYILRPGKNETAVRVAQRENNVIKLEDDKSRYQNMSQEAFIVAAMAQSGFVKYSERFASLVQEEIGRHQPGAKNNGVSQAGFLVLVGASMPNILIETGYLSNAREEKMLAGSAGQQRIAEGIAAAVKRYRSAYERSIAH